MIKIKFVTMVGCHNCEKVKRTFDEILPEFHNVQVDEIDATSEEGQKLIQKYSIMSSPGVIINEELFSMGGVNKKKLVEKLQSLSSS